MNIYFSANLEKHPFPNSCKYMYIIRQCHVAYCDHSNSFNVVLAHCGMSCSVQYLLASTGYDCMTRHKAVLTRRNLVFNVS